MPGEELEKRTKDLAARLDKEAEAGGYHLNPDTAMVMELCRGLVQNIDRYGYMACPCRLADGAKENDLDIICPCDYRDPDLNQYGACYCALYVDDAIKKGEKAAEAIPERRPDPDQRKKSSERHATGGVEVWRCKVCGYLCAREEPPGVCPICKAKKDRFEIFHFS